MRSFLTALTIFALLFPKLTSAGSKVSINEDHVLIVNGKKMFPIGFTMPPAPDAKAPSGKGGMEELADAGGSFMRTGPNGSDDWDDKYLALEQRYQDAAAKAGMFCLPWLKELSSIDDKHPDREKQLRAVIQRFKDHPGLGCWKGEDEPEWGKRPIKPLERAYQIIHEEDPDHPVWIVQAPRGTVDSMRAYNGTMDITGQDVYPIGYPPGIHSLLPNTDISLVGDHLQIMMDVTQRKKPIWMTLQIAWSGVVGKDRVLRMPTFHEERYMAYQAVINGARGLIFFGGNLRQAFSPEDEQYGWNWSFWNSVLRPVVQQLGDKSPLKPALVAPESKLPIKCKPLGVEYTEAKEIELTVREVDDEILILAASRGHATIPVRFTEIPPTEEVAQVMFEQQRKVKVAKGVLTDWFAPFEVHVYKLKRTADKPAPGK